MLPTGINFPVLFQAHAKAIQRGEGRISAKSEMQTLPKILRCMLIGVGFCLTFTRHPNHMGDQMEKSVQPDMCCKCTWAMPPGCTGGRGQPGPIDILFRQDSTWATPLGCAGGRSRGWRRGPTPGRLAGTQFSSTSTMYCALRSPPCSPSSMLSGIVTKVEGHGVHFGLGAEQCVTKLYIQQSKSWCAGSSWIGQSRMLSYFRSKMQSGSAWGWPAEARCCCWA